MIQIWKGRARPKLKVQLGTKGPILVKKEGQYWSWEVPSYDWTEPAQTWKVYF